MKEVTGRTGDGIIRLDLVGRIDSNNAAEVEDEIRRIVGDSKGTPILIDADKLEYISSAGLRVILRVLKGHPDMRIINVNSEIYQILDMTGFTQMMNVEKAYRRVSVDGCEVIGQGANGTIYRIDQDNVVKVYNNADALEDIQHEREVARLALVLGIPTAISYDVVRVGDSYGSVFELLNARSFSRVLAEEPEKIDWCVKEYVDMLKTIHGTEVPSGKLPDIRETALDWAAFMKDHLPPEEGKKLIALVEAVPRDDHMIHGDYHTKNLELVDDDVLLIDMDTLAVGHPVFEFGSIYNAFIGFSEYDHESVKRFQGFDFDLASSFWRKILIAYFGTDDEDRLRQVEDKARIIGYTRMIRRSIRRQGLETEEGRAEIDLWTGELIELLHRTDSLVFDAEGRQPASDDGGRELRIEATKQNLPQVLAFTEEVLEEAGCPMKVVMQIDIAVEEIFINIANYAYKPETGEAVIRIRTEREKAAITFIDRGVPYNPLAKDDPDVTLPAEQRAIGGLGIFMVKQSMDDLVYEFRDGQNIFTMIKMW